MSSFVSHLAVVGLVPLPLSFGYPDSEYPFGTWDLVPLKQLTTIASLDIGSAHRCIRSILDSPDLDSMRYMEYSLAYECFAPAVRTQVGETKTENWIGSVDVVNMDARNYPAIDSVDSDSASDSVGLHGGLEHLAAGRSSHRAAVCYCLPADATSAPQVCYPRCMS